MKKLKISDLSLLEKELLTRDQLKNVFGGCGGGCGSGSGSIECTVEVTLADGTYNTSTGVCGSTDQVTCNGYANLQCQSYLDGGAKSCHSSCF